MENEGRGGSYQKPGSDFEGALEKGEKSTRSLNKVSVSASSSNPDLAKRDREAVFTLLKKKFLWLW